MKAAIRNKIKYYEFEAYELQIKSSRGQLIIYAQKQSF